MAKTQKVLLPQDCIEVVWPVDELLDYRLVGECLALSHRYGKVRVDLQ